MKKGEKRLEEYTLEELREYRIPKEVVFIYTEHCDGHVGCDAAYQIDWHGCPRCHSVIEHDFQDYCGHCGQRVSWKRYAKLYSEK